MRAAARGRMAAGVSTTPPSTTPAFVAATDNKAFATTNTVPALSGVQAGDVLLAFAGANDQSTTLTAPAGLTWTQLADTGSGSVTRARLLVAVATGPLAATTWTWSGSHNHSVAIGAWRHVTAPSAAASATSAGTQVTTLDAPAQTTTATGSLLVCYGFHPSAAGTSRSFPVSMTSRLDDGAGVAGMVVAEETIAATGSTGTRTYTIAPGPAVLRTISVALAPG